MDRMQINPAIERLMAEQADTWIEDARVLVDVAMQLPIVNFTVRNADGVRDRL